MTNDHLLSLAEKYSTPLYVYDGNRIVENYRSFCAAFKVKRFKVHYACKALTNFSVLQLFAELGAGIDCVSLEEVQLGLRAGFAPADIIYTPNCGAEAEYSRAVELGVRINVDSLNILEFMGMKHPSVPVGVRINPHMMAGGNHKISVGHIDSKFGISIHQVPHIKRLVSQLGIKVDGIHIHTGSEILNNDIFKAAAELIYGVVREFPEVDYIDFGSGFKIAYRPGGLSTDIAGFGKFFSSSFGEFCSEMGRDYELKFEPGKFLVSDAGYFLTSINVVKQSTACVFAAVNSGFNHLIRPMFYDSHHEIENISNPDGDPKVYDVVGYICESDTFGSNRLLAEVRKNDVLLFRNAGAYCFSMASQYNSRLRPPEVLVMGATDYLVRERESFEDLLAGQPQPEISWQL